MRKIWWLVVIVFSGLGVFLSMLSPLSGDFTPLIAGLSLLFVSQILTALICLFAGWPGRPEVLDERKFYRLMGQVQIDGNRTVVVTTDAKGKVFCAENPGEPFSKGTEFVRTRKLSEGTWIISSSVCPSKTQPLKPEDSKETQE